ncbi:hypothetical protein RF11_03276 [Thelohanellus kitauei]|uniref:Uncharacterized protein n=1 Tax=Thelohanellus kitauei TaxID=669202 RepID=A0A0C2MW83_THEKT|nr:hypothetical protein RF11_03276 [Thelohanellus kitauei]
MESNTCEMNIQSGPENGTLLENPPVMDPDATTEIERKAKEFLARKFSKSKFGRQIIMLHEPQIIRVLQDGREGFRRVFNINHNFYRYVFIKLCEYYGCSYSHDDHSKQVTIFYSPTQCIKTPISELEESAPFKPLRVIPVFRTKYPPRIYGAHHKRDKFDKVEDCKLPNSDSSTPTKLDPQTLGILKEEPMAPYFEKESSVISCGLKNIKSDNDQLIQGPLNISGNPLFYADIVNFSSEINESLD